MSARQSKKVYRVLFICTGNSCRSQMAESMLRRLGGTRFEVSSAGTHPAGYIHPLAIEAMRRLNIPMDGQFSKSWNDLATQPQDIIITVCDNAACTAAPRWAGRPARAHWSLPDPSYVPGDPEARIAAALAVAEQIRQWLEQLIALPLDTLSPAQLEAELQRISET